MQNVWTLLSSPILHSIWHSWTVHARCEFVIQLYLEASATHNMHHKFIRFALTHQSFVLHVVDVAREKNVVVYASMCSYDSSTDCELLSTCVGQTWRISWRWTLKPSSEYLRPSTPQLEALSTGKNGWGMYLIHHTSRQKVFHKLYCISSRSKVSRSSCASMRHIQEFHRKGHA